MGGGTGSCENREGVCGKRKERREKESCGSEEERGRERERERERREGGRVVAVRKKGERK